MNFLTVNSGTGVVAGGIGAVIGFAFGGWSEALTFLLIAMAVDIISGVTASLKEGRGINSAVASVGLAKKGLMLLVIILAHRIDVLMELNAVVITAAAYFYIANELVSITENIGRAGLTLPGKLTDIIEVLKRKGDDK
ncbi:holin family protein [Paenibacillus sp. GCM10012307]|uniref:Phage holin family protein n=1 Tax=Paenibacillus roseus TaxID=2798579 RepID=A0A934JBQ9_9BACL|nr:phage holin family protein [Paenibacillus roseus]MBJ6364132.1 phage holin family protein [Paenibacillus roseus]